jgi:hypothetical protein
MNYGMHPGWIEVISGVMFSGKSEELIRRVRRATIARRKVQVFKSHLDSRYVGLYSVASHNGTEVEASPVDSAAEIFRLVRPDTEIVAIDEAQFLDSQVVRVATRLASGGVRVGRAVRLHGGADGDRGDGGQAAGHLCDLRRSRLPQSTFDRWEPRALRLSDHHDRWQRELPGSLQALPQGASEG